MKTFETLAKLSRIVALIRDPTFTATQIAIAAKLGCSERMCRYYFELLADTLDCPLVNHGRNGWELDVDDWAEPAYQQCQWDLWVALENYCEALED